MQTGMEMLISPGGSKGTDGSFKKNKEARKIQMITLEKDELKKILELNDKMNATPVVLLFGKHDIQKSATDRVVEYWKEMGEKYNFIPENVVRIDRETGEVVV